MTRLPKLSDVGLQLRTGIGRAVRQCRICSSAELSYEFIVDGCPVCRCAHCGLLFLNPPPSDPTDDGEGLTAAEPMLANVSDLHAANAASRMDQLMAYAGSRLRRLLVIANDAFLAEEARRRQIDVVSISSAEAGG